jgi:hypothetical protein
MVALIGLLNFTSLTEIAQNTPAIPIVPQRANELMDNAFDEPDII